MSSPAKIIGRTVRPHRRVGPLPSYPAPTAKDFPLWFSDHPTCNQVIWRNVDWKLQDIEIGRITRRSRERVRQVRKKLEKPESPRHRLPTESMEVRLARLLNRVGPVSPLEAAEILNVTCNSYFRAVYERVAIS